MYFDLFERVNVPDYESGIEELEVTQLIPNVVVDADDKKTIVKGNLDLNVTYSSDDNEKCYLEHKIPVEITIPIERINNLDDIKLAVQKFNIEVLSRRTFNLTGVLMLQGITVEV